MFTDDVSKVSLLKSLPDADARLVLFEADIYNPIEFESAIEGCEFVFHVATPLQHTENSQVGPLHDHLYCYLVSHTHTHIYI